MANIDTDNLDLLFEGSLPSFTNGIKISPDSKYIAYVNRYTFKFNVLEFREGRYENSFSPCRKGMIINIEFSPDSSHTLTASQDGRARSF